MRKSNMDSKKQELIELIDSLPPDKLDKFIIALEFIIHSDPAEMKVIKKQLNQKDFDVYIWIESIKSVTCVNPDGFREKAIK